MVQTRLIASPHRDPSLNQTTKSPKRLWLVGLMASGKSSVSEAIYQILKCKRIDMDALIVERQKMSIGEIFQQIQESGFRELEKQVVGELAQSRENLIIATGGGAPCFHNNMETMNQSGVTVFFDVPTHTVAQRTMDDEAKGKPIRPLVQGKTLEQRIDIFNKQLETRGPIYEEAKIIIRVGGLSVKEIVKAILEHNVMKGFMI